MDDSQDTTSSKTIRIDLLKHVVKERTAPARKIVVRRRGTVQKHEPSTPSPPLPNPGFENLFNSIYEAGLICDLRGTIVDANRRALELLNYEYSELCSSSVEEVIFGADHSLVARVLHSLENKQFAVIDACCIRRDSSYFTAEITVSKLDEQDKQLCFFIRDTTVRLQLETQLAHARKLESVGRLAAGIAHEVNTPIQFLSDNTAYVGRKFGQVMELVTQYRHAIDLVTRKGHLTPELLAEIQTQEQAANIETIEDKTSRALSQTQIGIDRIASIVRALKEFSYPSGNTFTEHDINRIVQNAITISRNEWKYSAEMELDLAPDLPPIPCLHGEIGQVILNLIINARDAIVDRLAAEGGTMGRISITSRLGKSTVEISVHDTGTGIPDNIKDLVFDPFFTTKEVGKGSGQGLAVVRSVIVNRHHGQVTFHNNEDGGTTFNISLPLHQNLTTPTNQEESHVPKNT